MAVVVDDARFEMGRVVGRILPLYGRNFLGFTILAALVALPEILLQSRLGPTAHLFRDKRYFDLLLLLPGIFVQPALIHAAQADLDGNAEAFSGSLTAGLKFFLPVLGITIASFLAVGVGLIFFIAPGIICLTAISVSVPVCVAENTGVIVSMERSWMLTDGYRWQILGLYAIYFVMLVAMELALRPLLGVALESSQRAALSSFPYVIGHAVQSSVNLIISSLGAASIYYESRMLKEGGGSGNLAAAFD